MLMTIKEFYAKRDALISDTFDIYTSPDFQCDQTGGFPTSVCVGKKAGHGLH